MKLCLGTVQFGMDYGIHGSHQQPYHSIDKIIEYAIRSGVDIFDTAAVYGEAEAVLGHYIKHNEYGAANIQIISKLAAGSLDNAPRHLWSDIVMEQAKKSLEALGCNRFKGYLAHDSKLVFDEDAVRALFSVKEFGLAEEVGISVYTPDEAMKALEYPQLSMIQVPYNLFDHRLDDVGFFDEAKKRNVTVFARSVLLQGLITMDACMLPENMEFAQEYLMALDDCCKRYSVSRLQAAIGYVNNNVGIDYIVFGVDDITQIFEFVQASEAKLNIELFVELRKKFKLVDEKLINPTMWNK